MRHWASFVGIGTIAGCFTLAIGLHHEVPDKMRTRIEMVMREHIESRWPGSDAFFQDLHRALADSLLAVDRSHRGDLIFALAATWVVKHCTGGKALQDEEAIVLEIAEIFRNESPGFWKSVQDFTHN